MNEQPVSMAVPDAAAELASQVAFVTGGATGIGFAIARALAARGATVAIFNRNQERAQSAVAAIAQTGGRAQAFEADVAQTASVETGFEQALSCLGRVDILVNNAGITRDGLLMRMSDADWDIVLNTNLKGAFCFTKAFSRSLLKQRAGRIINISSIIGLIGNAGQANYAASKAALIGFTKSCAREFGSRGITVNAIAPGFIETDMTSALDEKARTALLDRIPLNALGQPGDIAEAALYLAGPGGRYITGQVLTVDGGMVM